MGDRCDKYGFFNGIMGIEQTNWAHYWKGVVPDGVVAERGGMMEVEPDSGLNLTVKTGECMVDNHKVWLNTARTVELGTANQNNPRYDLVVIRVVYGNEKNSYAELDVIQGTPGLGMNGKPVEPTLAQVTGEVYEYALARVYVPSKAERTPSNIRQTDITDMRYIFSGSTSAISEFSETRAMGEDPNVSEEYGKPIRYCYLEVADGREYRLNNGANHTNTITNTFVIELPENPVPSFICGVNFTTADETVNSSNDTYSNPTEAPDGSKEFQFQGVTFTQGGYSYTVKTEDQLTISGVRYNLIIWWDGEYYWCAARAN